MEGNELSTLVVNRSLLSSVLINLSLVGVTVTQNGAMSFEELVQNLVTYRVTGRGAPRYVLYLQKCVRDLWCFFLG